MLWVMPTLSDDRVARAGHSRFDQSSHPSVSCKCVNPVHRADGQRKAKKVAKKYQILAATCLSLLGIKSESPAPMHHAMTLGNFQLFPQRNASRSGPGVTEPPQHRAMQPPRPIPAPQYAKPPYCCRSAMICCRSFGGRRSMSAGLSCSSCLIISSWPGGIGGGCCCCCGGGGTGTGGG